MKTAKEIVEQAMVVRPLTEINERECVAELALQVAEKEVIMEIGALYGGMTAVLALAAPQASIITIDNWSWHPEDDVSTSADLLYANMQKIGVKNVGVLTGDSRVFGRTWDTPLALLWVDGGHSYDWVFMDLMQFGAWAEVIAVHDCGNPFWDSVNKAVAEFIRLMNGTYYIEEIVGTVAVIRKVK
jgi:precorrin-6B methylase 2